MFLRNVGVRLKDHTESQSPRPQSEHGLSWFLFDLLFNPEDGRYIPPKRRYIAELHGIATQKNALFIVYYILAVTNMAVV
jgi:hypothetical protein